MSRSFQAIPLAYVTLASSATSTASLAAVDLAPYFPVGRREVKFAVAIVTNSTLTVAANVTILQGSSASTASSTSTLFSTVLGPDGSSGTWTSTADTSTAFEWHGVVTSRYITVRYNAAQATTGSGISIAVFAMPKVRAA